MTFAAPGLTTVWAQKDILYIRVRSRRTNRTACEIFMHRRVADRFASHLYLCVHWPVRLCFGEERWQNAREEEGRERLSVLKEGWGEETKDCMLDYLSAADVSLHYLSSWAADFFSGRKRNDVIGAEDSIYLFFSESQFRPSVWDPCPPCALTLQNWIKQNPQKMKYLGAVVCVFPFLCLSFGHFSAPSKLHN